MEERTAKVEGILEQVNIRLSRVESGLDQIKQEISQDFRWTVGMLITMWVSILLTILFKG